MVLCEREKSGAYGQEIFDDDNVLDGLDFKTLIAEIRCNIPKGKITFDAIKRQLKEDIDIRIQDAFTMLDLCKGTIKKVCKK